MLLLVLYDLYVALVQLCWFSCSCLIVVSSLKKQCSNDHQLEMDCIPKVVVNMFTAPQRTSEKVVDLTGRVDDKLVKALMPFQREGVEYEIKVDAHI